MAFAGPPENVHGVCRPSTGTGILPEDEWLQTGYVALYPKLDNASVLISDSTVGILCPNTPAFLESIFGIAAGGAVQVGVNFRLKPEDLHYVFAHAEVDLIIVDREFVHLLDGFDPSVRRVVDDDTDATEGELSGEFDDVIRQGLEYDRLHGNGWDGLAKETEDEDEVMALAYTSGTTAKPKVRFPIQKTHYRN